MDGKIGNVFVKDNQNGEIYEILRWSQDRDMPLYETTGFILKHAITGQEIVASCELLETYFFAVAEMEVLAWAAN